MKWLPRLKTEQWNSIFSGIQAVCVLAGTILALYGVFFTNLPETIIKQMRADIAATNEELVDLRQQRREIERQLEISQKRLGGAKAELHAKGNALSDLESKRTALSAQVQSIAREREKYFSNTYGTVVRDLIKAIRFHLKRLQEDAMNAREYPQVRVWLAEGRGLFSGRDQRKTTEPDLNLVVAWWSWRLREPEVWKQSHVWEDATRENATLRLPKKDLTEDKPYLDFPVYERQAQEFERALSAEGESPVTGHSLVQHALTEAELGRLTDTDQEDLRSRVLSAFSRGSEDMAGPLRVVLPPGWTEADIVSRGIAVIARLDRVQIAINALEHDLKTRAKQ